MFTIFYCGSSRHFRGNWRSEKVGKGLSSQSYPSAPLLWSVLVPLFHSWSEVGKKVIVYPGDMDHFVSFSSGMMCAGHQIPGRLTTWTLPVHTPSPFFPTSSTAYCVLCSVHQLLWPSPHRPPSTVGLWSILRVMLFWAPTTLGAGPS